MDRRWTLGDLVNAYPGAARVFHRHRLDYCCGGLRTLEEACNEQRLDSARVLAELEAERIERPEEASETLRWAEQPLAALVEHLVVRYHQPLRVELPRLLGLARKVEQVHRDKPTCPRGLQDRLEQMLGAMLAHLDKEERDLFPLVRSGQADWTYGTVGILAKEHADVGEDLRRIRELTKNFEPPGGACASWRQLYLGLEQLEAETMQHIHLENNILFPRMLVGERAT